MLNKLFILPMMALLMVASYGDPGKTLYREVDILGKLENLDVPEDEIDDDVTFFDFSWFTSQHSGRNLVNVDSFGAVGDGVSDDTQALISAWKMACAAPRSVLLVPQGRRYLVNATHFNGPCHEQLIIQIDGTIVAPDEPSQWEPKFQRVWLEFSNLQGVVFQGNGVIDGSGSKWWAASCKKNKSNPCIGTPTALTIHSSSSVYVRGLTIRNSQQMHLIIARSDTVRISRVMVTSPGDSPNTDGIHITASTNVIIQDCKISTGDDCVSIVNGSSRITIHSSSSVYVRGLTIRNSQQMHLIIARSDTVRISRVMVTSPGDSPNTDGIHITASTNVIIQDCKISTGDDCVSIVNGSSRIKMKKIYCGPGHGISIGSLGKGNSTGIVTAIVLDTALLKNTTNGLRIKTWQGGNGYVKGVRFENVEMQDVANPILIDQFYCDSPSTCQNQTSAVNITEIMYRNITGTTKSAKAIKFACSDAVPCSHIVLNNINLEGKDGIAEAYCNSAEGFGYGEVHPSADCLYSHDDKGLDRTQYLSETVMVGEETENAHDEL